MNPQLNGIKKTLKTDLAKYNETFENIMVSNVGLIDKIAKYIVRHKGKGLRPLLVLISAKLLGEPNQTTYIVASVIEILHSATLIHDDVVDDANVRRNFPSINAVWKNKISILMGDYLLSKSLISATQTGNLKIMQILAETAKRLSKGELFQIEKSRKLDITEDEYMRLIADKTAALIKASCELGSITVSDNVKDHKSVGMYGENLGIAFQIRDDLLDYQGNQKLIGKPVGADIKEKKITLPLILSLKKAPSSEKKAVIKLLKKGANNNEIKHIIAFCEAYGGLESAQAIAMEFAEKAKKCIAHYPESLQKENATNFVDYVINRKK